MSDERSRRPVLVVVGVVVALAVTGIALVHIGQDRPDRSSVSHAEERESGAIGAPGTARPSVGDGDASLAAVRDEAGAVDAAIAYTSASQQWLYLSDDEISEVVADIATADAAGRLATEVVDEVRMARDQLGESPGRVWWLVHPLAWRVERYSQDEATIAVWTMTLLSATEVAVPQTAWMTVTVDLEWSDGAWRVAAVRDRPGPTPMTGPRDDPWDARPFDDALAGFTRLPVEPAG